MFPPATATILQGRGIDAVHVTELGLAGTDDSIIAERARQDGDAVVTENIADYAGEHDVVLVFVLKRNLPPGGAQANGLAHLLRRWVEDNPEPFLGQHWPT